MKLSIFLVIVDILFFSCKKPQKPQPQEVVKIAFDKKVLLQNYADNLILPSYNSFSNALDSLILVYSNFKVSTNASDFKIVKQKLNVVYFKYQRINLYEFGPAEQELVRSNFNVFPTDSVQIKLNISTGSYDLSAAFNLDAKGLPALDFLFYDLNKTESQVINSFTNSANKKQYVSDLLAEMKTKIANIISTWNSSYKNQFINSLGTDVGSSIGFLVNQINFELDYLKNAKIGIPLGKKSLGIAIPEKCEAFYGKESIQYAMETLLLIENVYLGKNSSDVDGKGFDDYLDHLEIKYGSGTLNDAIKNQFSNAKNKLKLVTGDLDKQVLLNPASVDAAYAELVKLLILLKTDMPSSLGVVITYQDGDGD